MLINLNYIYQRETFFLRQGSVQLPKSYLLGNLYDQTDPLMAAITILLPK